MAKKKINISIKLVAGDVNLETRVYDFNGDYNGFKMVIGHMLFSMQDTLSKDNDGLIKKIYEGKKPKQKAS